MRTVRNILVGLTAFIIGVSIAQAANGNTSKTQKAGNGWLPVGPTNISGRVLAIHVDIANEQKVYAGTAGGGLWVTLNGGSSWSRSTGYTGPAAVSAIVQDNEGRLYIGTGEGMSASPGIKTNVEPFGIRGKGLYISDDGGITFSQLAGTESWESVNTMAFDKLNNKLYVGTAANGLQVSSDRGTNFSPETNSPIYDIKINGSVIIYSCDGGGNNVYVSTDNGNTFTSVCGTGAGKLPNNGGRISVAIAPSNPDVLYAFLSKPSTGAFYGVYVSENKGAEWKLQFPIGSYKNPMGVSGIDLGTGISYNTIAVSPSDPSKVLLGSYMLYEGNKYMETYAWSLKSSGYISTIVYGKNAIYLGTQSGIYCSRNGGTSYIKSSLYLNTLQVYSMSVANDGRIIAGSRDNWYVYMQNPTSADGQGTQLPLLYNDGSLNVRNSVFSLLKPEALFYVTRSGSIARQASFSSEPQAANSWYSSIIIMESTKDVPRWYYGEAGNLANYNRLVTPLIMWESINDIHSTDSITYKADKTYAPNDSICVKSTRNRYPMWMSNPKNDTLHKDSTILVQDVVTSRMFLGGAPHRITGNDFGAPVYMSLTAISVDLQANWKCIFRTTDATEQTMDLVVSQDGNNLFILTKKITTGTYSIYRVSGFTTYRSEDELIVNKSNLWEANPNRMLVDDTLLYEKAGGDITSIILDPQNNDHLLYTHTNQMGSRINVIENALTATQNNVTIREKEGTGIPLNIGVYTAIVEMHNSDIAYCGTEEGVYMTENFTSANPTWSLYNEGIEVKVPVFTLYQQTNKTPTTISVTYDGSGEALITEYPGVSNIGVIYAATHGMGIFIDKKYEEVAINDYHPIRKYTQNTLKVYPNPANAEVMIDFVLQNNEEVQLNIVDITGKVIVTENMGTKATGIHSEKLNCSYLSNGLYFINLKTATQNRTAKLIINKAY
jgi:hypothetical protein